MQERYVSLDPANAGSENRRLRREIFAKRLDESKGGEQGKALACQYATTGALLSYSWMRQRGFRMFPMKRANTSNYTAIFFAGFVGYQIARAYSTAFIGDRNQMDYLRRQKSAIMVGNMPMDKAL